MQTAAKKLPDDVKTLKSLLLSAFEHNDSLVHQNETLLEENRRFRTRVDTLQEQLNLALARRYAASSEKISADQLRLFDEAEVDTASIGDDFEEIEEAVHVAGHTRKKKRGRRPLPESLPRVEVVHELPESERCCPHDGAVLQAIGEKVSEQLDIVPASIRVIRHIRKQYACDCGQCLKTAPLPPQPIPRSVASPGLLAHIAVSKYQDALPLYRQERILERIGVDLPRASLAHWMIRTGTLIQPLINLLRDQLLGYDIVQMDETTVQVLKEPGKPAQSKSYLWVQRGGPPDRPIVLFDYDPSRSGQVPIRLLSGFSGYLQTDGYDGYNAVVRGTPDIVPVGCMAHARRRFMEAAKAKGKQNKAGIAPHGLALIQKLYRIEKQARDLDPAARCDYRQTHARPVLDKLRRWVDQHLPQVPPRTATGKALGYLNEQWDKLIRYLDDGRLQIDNNLTENAIRPFVLGRKNWLFSDTVKGVNASANLYSLIETAKANGLEPYGYLRRVFADLPATDTVEAIEALLPYNIATDQIPSG